MYKTKISLWHLSIINEVIPLHICNGIDQIIFLEEHLWETAYTVATKTCLTKDWSKNIIVASITASIWKTGKIYHKI